jgi:probable F420-dependent oxidoreductase
VRTLLADGPVGFGIQLPVQAQSTMFVEPWELSAGIDEMVTVTQACEQAGFSYVAVCDHIAIPRERAAAMSAVWWDTVATLSYLAAVTERVALLSHVAAVVYRHPLETAKQWATLDRLSQGRAVLGVGTGHVEGEFAALGVDYRRRGALLDEAIDALRAAFGEEISTHHGRAWSWEDMAVGPRPVQDRVPIWVGGSSPAALRRAALRGDGWLPQGPPEGGMSAGIATLRKLRADAGRSDEAFVIGALSGPLYVGEARWDIGRAVTGSAEEVAAFLRSLRDLGVNQIQVRFRSRDLRELCDQIRLFGMQVAPLVRE